MRNRQKPNPKRRFLYEKTFKKTVALLASAAMCGSMLLYYPEGTFSSRLPVWAAEGDAVTTPVAINEENFPDGNFREYVLDNCDTDGNGALSEAELAAVTRIDVHNKGIADLTGIGYFTELTSLICYSNEITELDLRANTALKTLSCYKNQLTELDLSENTALTYLDCDNNQLTELDLRANTALTKLRCYSNQLTELDLTANTALTELYCYDNQLTELDLRANTALTGLYCYDNQLTELPAPSM